MEGALRESVEALLSLERLVLPPSKDVLFDRLSAPLQCPSDDAADAIHADCSGEVDQTAIRELPRSYRVSLFAGLASEQALIAAILSGSIPQYEIEDVRSGKVVASGRPGGGPPADRVVETVLSRPRC